MRLNKHRTRFGPVVTTPILFLATLGFLVFFSTCAEPVDSQLPPTASIPAIDDSSRITIVTWNIEHFPQMGNRTIERVQLIMDSLDADFYCLQEIEDKNSLQEIVDHLDRYSVIISDETYMLNLAIVYKQEHFLPLFTEDIFARDDYNFAGRPPLMVSFAYELGGVEQVLNLIDVHMKCCDNGIERRHNASRMLHDYLRDKQAWGDSNFVVPGDWNDDIHDVDSSGAYSFEAFLQDPGNFLYVTDSLAATHSAYNASYPRYDSFIDNILISRSLYDEFRTSTVRTLQLDYTFGDYSSVLSDHRPVLWSFQPNP